MRNPLSNSNAKTWMGHALSKCRDAFERLRPGACLRKSSQAWVIGVLLCVFLAGCISLVEMARRDSSKSQGKATIATTATATTTETNLKTAAAEPEEKPSQEISAKTPKKAPREAKNGTAVLVQEKEHALAPLQLKPVVSAPPVDLEDKKEGEKEDPNISRKRQSWFFDQRAYPNKHIPTGAYQKALEQRDAMKARQRVASASKTVADSIISFPGDALWHLMGPQPINNPFGQNGGFPTASGRITAIAVDPTNASIVYVGGAAGGVWKTTTGGTSWAPMTDTQPSLAIGSITIDPNSCTPGPCTTIYVGTGEENFNSDAFYGAGILKSMDGGNTWAQMGASTFAQALSPQIGGAYIGQIAVQPGNPNIVLAAVSFFANGTIGGIFRSTDAGNTWTEDAAPRGLGATSVFFETTSNTGTTATAWMAMGDPFPPVTGEAANGIYKSTDSGATWTIQTSALPTTNLGRITLGYAPSTSGATATVYAAIANSSTGSSALLGLFKTTTGGTTWTAVTGPAVTDGFCAEQCFYDMAIGVHPTNPSVVVLGGGPGGDNFTSLFESTNGGTSWTPATGAAGDFAFGSNSTHVHVDTHAIVFTANGATLYVGDDGGIWSTNTPQPAAGVSPTWTDLNAGLAITQFYPGPTAAVSDENYGFGGTQDNDTELFQNSLLWQNEFICGDGGFTAIDQTTPTTIWAACNSTAGTKVKKAVMNGQFVTLANSQQFPGFDVAETAITNSGDNMQFIPPIALDESNPDNLYFGTCRVWMTSNAASSLADSFIPLTPTWTAISGDLSINNEALTPNCPAKTPNPGAGNITNLEVAHSNSSVIVAGTSNGLVWETTSGGALWTEIDAGALPNRTVTAVRTKRSDSTGAIVYVTFSGFDCGGTCTGTTTPGHVFKTTTAGTTNTWTNITGDLPDIPVNDIIVDHSSNPTHDALYIATDVGVFACPNPEAANPCANWTVVGDGLPNSPVLGLAMRRSSRILRAATHGRSMWDIQLTDVQPGALALLSGITPAAVNVVPGGAGTTAITITGLNFSANTQVQFDGITTGVTTTFVNTTQLNVTLSNTLLENGGVNIISLTDPAGVDSSASLLAGGGAPFAVMNTLLDPLTMTPSSAMAYTAVPFQLTAIAAEPFVQNSVLAFYDTSNPPNLKFQLPMAGDVPTLSGGGTTYKLTTAITDLTTPGTYQVVPYNPTPGGGIDYLAITAAGAGGPVPFTFTVTANPGPVIQVSSPLTLAVNAVGANTGSTYNFFQVSNLVGATLNITAATITGTNKANFQFIAPGGAPSCNFESTGTASITAGSFCFFGLEYTAGTPPGNANSVATLNITDNASGSPQAFPITGTILGASGIVFLGPVNFGAVAVGTTSPTMNATLTNATTSSVSVTSGFSISGANLADFHLVPFVSNGDGNSACPTSLPFPLASFASCDVSLTFTPSLPAGNESGQLNVTASVAVTTTTPNLTGIGIEITSISPSIVATGGPAFTLTVNGGGFAPSAVVNVNGSARLTTFVSATQLLASIPASDIATAGSLAISVTTPLGGSTSEPKTLIVAQAEPASNDNVNFAVNATPTPFRITQDNTRATAQLKAFTGSPATPIDPTPCATGSTAKSVWFQFTAPATGKVVADTRFSSYTTNLSAWTISTPLPSSTATFAPVACNTLNVPGTVAQSLITFPVTSGTVYYLMVTDASAGAAGGTLTFSLDFAAPPAPTNDNNASPTVISATPFSNTENTIEATANTGGNNDPVPPCAAGAASSGQANSVWYEYTPTSNGTITADTLTSPYETILNVTSVTPNGTQVACNVSASSGIAQSQVSFAATSGVHYFFMVSAFLGDGGTTNFHLTFNAGVAGVPATITATSGTPQSTAINSAFGAPLVATVLDSFSNPVSGANVTFTAPGAGASGKFSNNTATITIATSGAGVASAPFTANATAGGPYTVTATVPGVATPANYSLTNNAGAAASMTANAGTTPQSATINTAFANALAVTVKDAGSNPVSGVNVTFTAPGSGASGKFSNNTATIIVATNASGVASAPFTANSTAGGPYNVTAAATGLTTVNFSLTNNAGAAASMTANAGTTPQSATINTAFANALAVTVTDAGSNPISGVNVTFTAPGSGASGKFSNNTATIIVATNASGVASAAFTANATTGGPYTVTAAATGLTTVNFSLTNNAGAAASMTANAGTTPQSATINTAFANALAVTVKDAGSNPVSGVNVTFTAPGSGASGKFSNNTATITIATNASGVASAPFTANATAGGPYNVTAAATGLTTVNFSLTNNAGAAASMTANAGTTPQSAAINTAFANALAVTVKDAGSNPVSGVNVTFTAPGSGASGKFSNNTATIIVATNASGVASTPFTANSTAGGPYSVTAAATGLTTVNFSLTNNAGAAASMTANAGTTPQSATINTAFANALAVMVTDAGSNPVSGVNVTFTAPGSGASGKFSNSTATISVATNASGVASAPFTANATAGGPYTVAAAATGVATVNFSLTNLTGAAGSMTANAGTTPQSAAINSAFANALAVTVKDAGSNPVSGVNVTFTAPGSGASGAFSNSTATITVATNASGVASAPFTANATAGGPYNVTAAATGLATVNFSLTNTAGAASSMTANVGTTPQSATINTAFANALAVTVKDAGSNPVSGVNVTFTAPGSGASGKFSNNTATIIVATNASGVASAPFTANATAGGPYTVTAAATGLTTVNFSLTNTAGAASSMTANAGTTPQSATINTAFANALAVTVKDASSNPISGVNVTFTAPGSGASGKFSNNTATISVPTNASGVASAPFTANATAGGPYTVTATAAGLTAVNFSLTNNAGAAALMTVNAGSTPQSTAVSTAFANALAVTVNDASSNPVSGVNVTFTAPGSGASGKFSNNTATITVATNASGVASAPFTANATAGGPYTVTAAATGLTTVNFSLTNTAGAASSMTANAGTTPQSATINTAFANALAVTVKDASSNPISGVNVTFTAPGTGASGVFSNNTATINVATNASGIASAPFTANAAAGGPYTVTASAAGVSAVNFSLTNNAGTPSTMTANAGTTPQSATINTAFASALAVTVKDAASNPVSGVNVTFTAPGAGASGVFSNNTATIAVATNASGVASAPFTANATTGGPYTVTAAAAGLTTVNFLLTNNAGPAASITATAGTPQNTAINTAFAILMQATVKDAGNNPVSGVTVTFAGPASGASGAFTGGVTTATTNAAGVATAAVFTANATAGTYTVTAKVAGVATAANFSLTNNPGPPASITATAGTPQTATTGTAFTTQLQATVKDAGNNLVSGAVVIFAAPASGASGAFAGGVSTATTNASGVATAPVFTANGTAGAYTVTAKVAGVVAPANFSLTNNNVQPTLASLVPATTLAGGAAFPLTINGNGFVNGATVSFGTNPALVPTTTTPTQIIVTIPPADITKAGQVLVTVTNPPPSVGPSLAQTFTVNNPVPTLTTLGQTHAAGGTAFTLTVNGTNFVATSVVNFGTKAEPTTFVSATQITAAIPASDVSTAGNVNVSVQNPTPGGGPTPTSIAFVVDGFLLAGPSAAVTVKAGSTATIPITITPSANGFSNPVTFSVTGLPAHASLVALTTTPGNAKSTVNLMIMTTARAATPPVSPMDQPLTPMLRILLASWIAVMLAGLYAARLIRRTPRLRRYAAIVPLALLLISGVVLAGCASAMNGTPAGTSSLTVTATSGSLSESTPATLTVQ